MRAFISALAFVAAAIQHAYGAVYITAPVGSSKCNAGSNCPVSWNDDGQQPTLAQIGLCNVGLYVGSPQVQYLLQSIGSVTVSEASNLQFTPDASVGANSDQYFVRFTSLNLNSTAAPMYPYEAFSSKFSITGMTGQFNSTIQQVMSSTGALTPTGTTSSGSVQTSGTGSTTGTNTATSKVSTTTTTGSATHSGTPTSSTGAAVKLVAGASSSIAVACSLLIVAFSGLFAVL